MYSSQGPRDTSAAGSLLTWPREAMRSSASMPVSIAMAGSTAPWVLQAARPATIVKDLRSVTPADFAGFDAVLHLAELSNDPLGENNPAVTYEINHRGSVRIAELANAAGVRRFVYASSCSVYGVGAGEFLDETSPVNPQTAYARCKVLVEQDVAKLAGADFSVVFLRNSTAYGPSPRMRFDIVLNDLCARAWTTKLIAMTSNPFLKEVDSVFFFFFKKK